MGGILHDGRWYADTGMACRRCGLPVYRSDNPEYVYQCFACDEDLYSFEAVDRETACLEVARMKDRGCAFLVKENGAARYYTSPAVSGLAEFARFLLENREDSGGKAVPLAGRIPQAEEIPEAGWLEIADSPEEGRFSCFFMADLENGMLWVNEDRGGGMAYYVFPVSAVLDAAASGTEELWERLLLRYPGARVDSA